MGERLDTVERVQRIEAVEREAWLDGDAGLAADARRAIGRRIGRWGEVVAIATDGNPSVTLNRVIGLGLAAPADDALLDAIAAHYGEGPNDHSINLCPIAAPADLPQQLSRRGYGHYFDWIKWWRDDAPAPVVETSLRIARAGIEDADRIGAVAAQAFGFPTASASGVEGAIRRPAWRYFVAWDGATPVASAAVFIGGDAAWFGAAGTLPSHRGRGAQRALLAARIEAAREAGCTLMTVETGPDSEERPNASYRNVARAGFQLAYARPSWIHPDPGMRGATR